MIYSSINVEASNRLRSGFFVGLSLEQVCFSENQVSLHFGREVGICVESALSHVKGHEPVVAVEVPLFESDLMLLLGHVVQRASASADGTLTLSFDNQHVLSVYDTWDQYESYKIHQGTQVIIV